MSEFFVVLILSFVQMSHLQYLVNYASTNGIGFLSRKWVSSDTLAFVRKELSSRRPVYSNEPEIIETHLKIKSRFLPRKENPLSKEINENYQNSLHKLHQEFSDNHGILIYIYEFSSRTYIPGLAELRANIDMDILYEGRDGIILQVHK